MTSHASAHNPRPVGTPVPPLLPGPLSVGTIISRGFTAVTQNLKPLVVWAMLLPLAVHLVFAVPTAVFDAAGIGEPGGPRADASTIGIALLTFFTSIIYLVISMLGGAVLQGYVANGVRFEALGHRATAGELWAATRAQLGRLMGYGGLLLAFGIALAIVMGIVVFVVAFVVATVAAATSAVGPALLLFALLGLGIAVPLSWLSVRITLAPAIIVCEHVTAWAALRRSWELTRGRGWRLVGVYVLLGLAYIAFVGVLTLIVVVLIAALLPNAVLETGITGPRVLATYLGSLPVFIGSAGLLPVSAVVAANAYLDARTRSDALAFSLYNYHSARAAGYAPAQLADPFVAAPPAPPTPTAGPYSPPAGPVPTDPPGPYPG
ncbi:hypothetical protein ACF07D_10980 [Leucobacter sp. NPDC015123]|uniref:hypothetical protein n=1 Tax=Leucobacter sp. NPDC015123 TaxID=3364129 RepID=UPI0036F45920